MSEPTTFEFAVISVKTAAGPPAVFTTICGLQTSGFNRTLQTQDRYPRDCAAPAKISERRVRVTGRSRTLTGTGLANADQIELINTRDDGASHTIRYVLMDISDPETQAGTAIGTYEGPAKFTSIELGTSENGEATISLTLVH